MTSMVSASQNLANVRDPVLGLPSLPSAEELNAQALTNGKTSLMRNVLVSRRAESVT